MITAVRAALFCDEVRADESGISLIGLQGASMMAESRPGFLTVTLFVQADVDVSLTEGAIRIQAGDYDEAFRFSLTTDRRQTVMVLPVILPVARPGRAKVTISDDAHRRKAWIYRWAIDSRPDAQILPEAAAAEILTDARASARILRGGLSGPRAIKLH